MLRAGEHGSVGILVPMVTRASEVALVRSLAEECRKELGLQKAASIGAMIEVPAAAFIARDLAKVSDFFSIGTNDLMQYTLASDRSDDDVATLYESRHPAVQQLITMAAAAAKEAGIPLTVCGELASNPDWTETFLNLDIDCLSMSLSKVLYVRRELSQLNYKPFL
jgi:phosphotransferase system enzyme I (PtsI)